MRSLAKTFAALTLAVGGMLAIADRLAAAEVTKTLKAELSGADLGQLAIENLADDGGSFPVPKASSRWWRKSVGNPGTGRRHAAREGARGGRRRVAPSPIPGGRSDDPLTANPWTTNGRDLARVSLLPSSTYHYDGRNYRISTGHGKRLSADLQVHVPPRLTSARFRNLAGLLEASDLQGGLRFDVASADLRLTNLSGDLTLAGSWATSARRRSTRPGSRTFRAATADRPAKGTRSLSTRARATCTCAGEGPTGGSGHELGRRLDPRGRHQGFHGEASWGTSSRGPGGRPQGLFGAHFERRCVAEAPARGVLRSDRLAIERRHGSALSGWVGDAASREARGLPQGRRRRADPGGHVERRLRPGAPVTGEG